MMLDITDNLKGLLAELDRRDIESRYVAVWQWASTARATIDIDLLILSESLDKVIEIAKDRDE